MLLDDGSQLPAIDQGDVVPGRKSAGLIREDAGSDGKAAGSPFAGHDSAQLSDDGDPHLVGPPVLALHEVGATVLAQDDVNTTVRAKVSILDGKALLSEPLQHEDLEFAPAQTIQAVTVRGFGDSPIDLLATESDQNRGNGTHAESEGQNVLARQGKPMEEVGNDRRCPWDLT